MPAPPDHDGRRPTAPPLVPLTAWPRLTRPAPPAPLTSLVGREGEIAAAGDLVRREDVRLLTLTGAGGAGKTRLALAVASAVAEGFADGVAWIELAAITDPERVIPAIAAELGVRDGGDRSSLRALVAALHGARLLLVLDNVEQVIDAAPDLGDLLVACPALTILATSRAALRVRGEHVLVVPPLPALDPAEEPAAERLLAAPAVRLFADRLAAASGVHLGEADASAAAEICRRLDGLPLAIELAAARASHLPLAALLARLDRRLPLLTSGPRDLPSRQRTLRDTIAWSYDLLSSDAQRLFRRLAVFVDGFRLEMAEAIATGDDPWDPPAFDLLGALVELSLVRFEPGAPGGPRYRMLETIREFAAERLASDPELPRVRAGHSAASLAFAERHALEPFGAGNDDGATLLGAEHGNVLAALAWFDAADDGDELARLVAALSWFWWSRGHWRAGWPWLERAWALAGAGTSTSGPAVATELALAMIATAGRNDPEFAERVLSAAIERRRTDGDTAGIAIVLLVLGWVANGRERYDLATERLRAALDVARALPDRRQAARLSGMILTNLGDAARFEGRPRDARACHEEALRLLRGTGAPLGVGHNLVDLGFVLRDLGETGALDRFREGLESVWAQGDSRYVVAALEGIASVLAVGGTAAAAPRLLGAGQRLRERIGMSEDTAVDRATREATVATSRAALGEAGFAAAWEAGRALAPEQAVAEALAARAGPPPPPPAAALTPRERDVLRLLVTGRTDRQIAEALFVGERTVESHVARIFAKLGVRTRAAAAVAAVAAGLVDPSDPEVVTG